MLIKEVSYFQALTTWPTTDRYLFSKQRRKIYKIRHMAVNIYPLPWLPGSGQSLRSCKIYPWLYSPWVQAAGSDSLPGWVCRVMQTLIGQPFYKARSILGRVASVAGASAAATLALPGRSAFPRPTKAWKPCGGEWKAHSG